MTIMFPSQACAFTCTIKTYLLLKPQFKNNTRMKGMCQNTSPILGSFVDCHENDLIIAWQIYTGP